MKRFNKILLGVGLIGISLTSCGEKSYTVNTDFTGTKSGTYAMGHVDVTLEVVAEKSVIKKVTAKDGAKVNCLGDEATKDAATDKYTNATIIASEHFKNILNQFVGFSFTDILAIKDKQVYFDNQDMKTAKNTSYFHRGVSQTTKVSTDGTYVYTNIENEVTPSWGQGVEVAIILAMFDAVTE